MKPTSRLTLASLVALTGTGSTLTASAQEAAAAAAKPEAAPKWKQSAGLGFSLTDGNSDTLLLTASYDGSKRWGHNEVLLGLNGGYGESDNVRNNEFIRGFGQYNWFLGEAQRLYGFGRLGALYDGIADIDYRISTALGLGYYFLKEGLNDNKRFNLSAELGPGYVFERVGGQDDDFATVYVAERFTWKISERSRLWQGVNFTPQVSDFDNYVVNFELGVASKMTERVELRAVFTDTYRSRPASGRVHNDLTFVTAIGYTF